MLERFLLFLLKVTGIAFMVVVFIVGLCSYIVIRYARWSKLKKKRQKSHHHSRGRSRSSQTITPSSSSVPPPAAATASSSSSSNPLEGTLVVDAAETGSTGKVRRGDDVPPVYDFPPAYDSLFPTSSTSSSSKDEDLLDEILIIANQGALQNAGILELSKSQSQQSSEA